MSTPAIPARAPLEKLTGARHSTRERAFEPARMIPVWGRVCLGVFLVTLGILLIYLLIVLWPAVQQAAVDSTRSRQVAVFGFDYTPTGDESLLLLVVIASALGSFVHAATSFIDYAGNRRLATSWVWWYLLRVFVGTALALLFYFAVRGGFFGADTSSDEINPYGIAALAGLVGLFSKQATDKLREVFDTLFRVLPGHGDEMRDDSITNPEPVVGGIEPSALIAGELVELRLEGDGFTPESVVRISRLGYEGGALLQRETTYIGQGELRVRLLADDVAEAGKLELMVFNPPPGGGSSGSVPIEVGDAGIVPEPRG